MTDSCNDSEYKYRHRIRGQAKPSIKVAVAVARHALSISTATYLKITKLQGAISQKATKPHLLKNDVRCIAPQPRHGSTCTSHAASTALEFDI